VKTTLHSILGTILLLCSFSFTGSSAELLDATQQELKALHLDSSVMSDFDKEIAMPKSWLDAAKNEPPLKIMGTWDPPEWKILSSVFSARFPSIKLQYNRSVRENRVQALVAFQTGRYVTDILSSYSETYSELKKANALVDLHELPNFSRLIAGAYDPAGLWIGQRISYWCMAYNTDQVSPANLPKDWDDLLTDPFWRNGKFAVSNTPSGWLTSLYAEKGPSWAADFIKRLFTDVKPQRRKEGREAAVKLTSAGEMAAVAPSSDYRTHQFAQRGAPVSFHCPSIVPASAEWLGILRGSPAQNSAKIFLNWFLSKEGQLAIHAATGSTSPHVDFQRPEFVNFPDQTLNPNKKVVFDPFDQKAYGDLNRFWNSAWSNQLSPSEIDISPQR
jgi:iron(III) transport system substrate-binding protein